MRPTLAMLRAGAPIRAALLGTVAVMCIGAAVLTGGSDAGSIDQRGVAIMLLEFGMLPVFAAMLGGALVRGEHAPWTWGLARPIRRTHWAATALALDGAALCATVALIRALLGEAPSAIRFDVVRAASLGIGGWDMIDSAGPALIVMAYVAAAVGAARGRTTIRGLPIALGYVVALVLVAAVVLWLDDAIAHCFLVDAWPTPASAGLLATPFEDDVGGLDALVTMGAVDIIVVGGLAHVLVRAILRLPALVLRREIVVIFALWIVGAAVCSWSLHSRLWAIADAPLLAQRGDGMLEVTVPSADGGVVLAELDCADCFARRAFTHSRSASVTVEFRNVVPARYRLCSSAPQPVRSVMISTQGEESCVEIDVASGENRFDTAFEPSAKVPVSRKRQLGWERDARFEKLVVVRGLAELLSRAFAPTEVHRTSVRGIPR
jgi:hypothetical protein